MADLSEWDRTTPCTRRRSGRNRFAPLRGCRTAGLFSALALLTVLGCRYEASGDAQGEIHSTVSDATFDRQVLQSDRLVLVDFGADWCGPCHLLKPVMEDLASAYEGRAVIEYVDVDDLPGLTQQYGIEALPTVLFFRDGEELERIVGVYSYTEMRMILERHLSAEKPPA